MANPKLLPCDSDVLIQLFLVDELRPFQELKKSFGIQPTVSLEVDVELRWLNRYRDQFVPQLEKALQRGVLAKLDQRYFQSLLSETPPTTSWASYQALGAQYDGYIGMGEAYTYAAAITFGVPAVSNDYRAIQTLQGQMLSLPTPVLRGFDLLVFALDVGILPMKDCERIRSELVKNGEGIPRAFTHSSFENGLKSFKCRLQEGKVSRTESSTTADFFDPLTIARV